MDATKEVQGTALYAEFSKGASGTLMLLITPDGYSEDGEKVEASLYRRVVTSYSPKRQWRNTRMPEVRAALAMPNDEKPAYAEQRLASSFSLLEQIITHGWTLVKQPLFVEVSKRDLSDIRNRRTPSKIIYRINQSRKALGFPDPTSH
jgi:hypothetical protein